MTIVLDTNVIVAALVAKGLCHEVVLQALGDGTVATSPALLEELERTLRGSFDARTCRDRVAEFRLRVHVVTPAPLPAPASRDTDDDEVLAAAVAASAEVIVTGDQDLLVLRAYHGIEIVTPREFLSHFSA